MINFLPNLNQWIYDTKATQYFLVQIFYLNQETSGNGFKHI